MSDDASMPAPTQAWLPGAGDFPVMFDNYRILGVIGEGGMGTVYMGYHLNLRRFVAIKTLRIDRVGRPDLIARFRREMQSIGQMDHPNVVRATDAGEKNGVFYLVMEYLPGTDLARVIKERGPLPSPDACELTRQAALGLAYVHQTIIHRDIKPSNLMLTNTGLVKILDLGLARLGVSPVDGADRTPDGTAVGTYDYMAPEQADASEIIDGRADIYSLGCTFFKLLTGQPPYFGSSYDNAARKIFAHCNIPLSDVPAFSTIPARFQSILLRMTAKRPTDRFASAKEVADILAPLCKGHDFSRLIKADNPLPLIDPQTIAHNGAELQAVLPTPDFPQPTSGTHIAARPNERTRWAMISGGILLVLVILLGWMVGPAVLSGWKNDDTKKPVEEKEIPKEFALPLKFRAPLPLLENLTPLERHAFLNDPKQPPTILGFRLGQGLASGRWIPHREQLDITPTDPVLIQVARTNRDKASFTMHAYLTQRPWAGSVGVFWGYQEDLERKKQIRPDLDFGRFQYLLVAFGREQFHVERGLGTLKYADDDRIIIGKMQSLGRHPIAGMSGEKHLEIIVENGRLQRARFDDTELKLLCTSMVNRPVSFAEYQGSMGIFSLAAHVTVRKLWVMPHAP